MPPYARRALALGAGLTIATACASQRPQHDAGTGPSVAGVAPDVNAVVSGVYLLGQALEQERARTSTLQRQLDQRTQEVQTLRAEVDQIRGGAAPPPTLATARGGTNAAPAAEGGTGAAGAPQAAPTPVPQALAALRSELTQEKARRVVVEDELARLRRETSTSPYQKGAAPAPQLEALVVAKQQVASLQAALADERRARERLTNEVRALQARSAGATPAGAEDAAVRSQLEALQREKDTLIDAFNRNLAESKRRSAELEQALTAARRAPGVATGGAANGDSLRAENETLRQRLDDERRRTDELAAKLRAATRVADLIFKMQAQDAPTPSAPALPR